ncbi:MAG: NAD(P)-binding domain-containing protein [Pseudomonadota bacterium]
MKIGVAGTGRMGLGMARALDGAGFDVTGFDVRPVSEFGTFVDRMQPDATTFAVDREVVLSVVRDIDQTEDLLFRKQAILKAAPDLRYLVICSTLSPRYLADLRSRLPVDLSVIDAPMSGAQIAADEARLSFMLGGDDADLDALEPMFLAMGPKLHRMGGFGAGMTAKVLNNFVAACGVAGARQAIDWAEALDVDREKLFALMNDSSGQNWFVSNFADIEFSRDGYDPDNTIGILKKDVESCLDAVPEETRAGLPETLVEAIGRFRRI